MMTDGSPKRKRQKRVVRHPRGAKRPRPKVSRGAKLMQRLISEARPSFQTQHIEEPKLVFARDGRHEDPKTGIALYGPRELDRMARSSVRLGIIGTAETIQMVLNWIESAKGRIRAGRSKRGKPYDPVLAPDFPGFDVDSPYECSVDCPSSLQEVLSSRDIEAAANLHNFRNRVAAVVELVANRLAILKDREPEPEVVVCAMPEIVDHACGPQGRVGQVKVRALTPLQKATRRLERRSARAGQLLLPYNISDDTVEEKHWDFHNALKVHAMKYELPTQLIWESTLARTRDTQDPATVAWNFFTALYYKAGNIPWELDFRASGTCFVGVSFYRESPEPGAATRTSLAQVFSEYGEGLVIKGDRVHWDQERDRKPHLSREGARGLLEQALGLYRQHNGEPKRVVVHKTSRYWPEELDGFMAGLGDIQSYDLLTLERRGIRFLRLGSEPPLRGTMIQLARRNYLLYTRGYVPYLRAYPGMRVPNPLEIVEHHGDSTGEKVCSEILALTKLNWNSCRFAGGDPITTAFSRQVGTILTELPEVGISPLTKYKFYM